MKDVKKAMRDYDKYSIKSIKYNATIQNMYKNGDNDIEWYMEFREVIM